MKYLITTALAYTNGPLHLGHVRSTYIPADILYKYLKLKGEEVIHVGGTDNHGVPILLIAEKEGKNPEEIVEKYHNEIKRDLESLNIEFDVFGKTHSDIHIKTAQEFFLKLKENGYIYEKEIEQFYCENCKKFLPDRYVEGTCPYCGGEARGDHCESCGRHIEPIELKDPYCVICGNRPVIKKTIHYFFKLSALKEELERYIKNAEEMPEHVRNLALNWINELRDWDVSRDISWGVPIPGSDQVMYVWLEAPIGYISFTKMINKENYWVDKDTKIYHFIGKDIIVHHAVFWPGMLIAHKGYNLPTSVIAGGYLTLEGKKMSTSKRWVIWVKDFVEVFEPDYLRYYLIIASPLFKDSDFSFEEFKNKINNELINIIGNFTHRVLTFTYRKFKSVPVVDSLEDEDKKILDMIEKTLDEYDKNIRSFKFREALVNVLHLAIEGNSYFQKMEPWNIESEDRLKQILYVCCKLVKTIAYLLYPYMPKKSKEILDIMNEELDIEIRGNELKKPKIVFKKVEDDDIERLKNKLKGDNMEFIDIQDFQKIDLRVGKIVEAEEVKGSKKLLRLTIDLGNEKRQIVSGIKEYYKPEELINKKVIVICNLKPAKIFGITSEGMILAAEDDKTVSLLTVDRDVKEGSKVR
ncbi:methionyl-tRNA ligase [Methanocaldococcus villosus KIN24-T80]|uniref:Methionine--tRNA ligase n=1 Tax=Methanocaldococcus villosus KIN24-T80 TaxID=1069083 RepID=N6VQI1_9EURY|nr:methionine--tRNA ligase [Methanocaldococcus villosus]ENN96135.1 methionyl-tRNA ligase [Methanocaldococcus villosus KIN24-T80]